MYVLPQLPPNADAWATFAVGIATVIIQVVLVVVVYQLGKAGGRAQTRHEKAAEAIVTALRLTRRVGTECGVCIRFHDLRHSCLSLLAQRGEPIRDLQALAGHASAAFTLQRYTHHYGASARRTADTMGDILSDVP